MNVCGCGMRGCGVSECGVSECGVSECDMSERKRATASPHVPTPLKGVRRTHEGGRSIRR